MQKQKILIVGNFNGHLRSQQFVQKLLYQDIGTNSGFLISMANPSIYTLKNSKSKWLKLIFDSFFSWLFIIELFFKIPFCDKIYFLAMNHWHFPKLLIANFLWRKPVIADMYISVYDSNLNKNRFSGSFLKRLPKFRFEWYYKFLDRLLIERSDRTIYVSEVEFKLIVKLVNANLSRSNYIIIPPVTLPKEKTSPIRTKTYRICWWGTFTPFHGVDNIIKAAVLLKAAGFDFTINLFGTPNHDSTPYRKLANEHGLENVFFHTDKTFGNGLLEEHLIHECDLALGIFSNSKRALRAVPTKIFDAFSMSIPVLTMDTAALRGNLNADTDLFTCSSDPSSIGSAIMQISQDPVESRKRARAGYDHYKHTFSVSAVQSKFIKLFPISL